MTAPSTVLPKAARDKFRDEAQSIIRAYKSPGERREALEHAIAALKEANPDAFRKHR